MSLPDDWGLVRVDDVIFSVPPGLRPISGRAVDSTAGGFESDDLRITYDVGRFGPDLDALQRDHGDVTYLPRLIAGRRGIEASFVPTDEPFEFARIAQVVVSGDTTATIRVSCRSQAACGVADQVFNSLSIHPVSG